MANQGRAVSRQRVDINAKTKDFGQRFALRLREVMDKRKLSSADVAELITKAGVSKMSARGVDAWLRGTSGPKFRDLERIGRALGFEDYRDLLPQPAK